MRPNLFHCLLTAIALLFASCDPSEMKQEEHPKDTTYTIDFQIDAETLIGLDGATVTNDLRICEYNDKNERINIQDLRNIKYGSKQHLQRYVDEFTFRFNTRNDSDIQRFDLLLCNVA